jgi:hypothetical protein
MKLAELPNVEDIAALATAQLREAGLQELASYIGFPDEGSTPIYVATDIGIYVGTHGVDGRGKVQGTVTPWGEAAGARLVLAGFGNEYTTAVFRLGNPQIDESAHSTNTPEGFQAICELARTCLRLARGWQMPEPARDVAAEG